MTKSYISKSIRDSVAKAAKYRCGYCLTQTKIVGAAMQIEHIIPESLGGQSVVSNLWLACATCNAHKWMKVTGIDPETKQEVALFNPRTQSWDKHFGWSVSKTEILGLTSTGRATVTTLQMNNHRIVKARMLWVSAGWHPPLD